MRSQYAPGAIPKKWQRMEKSQENKGINVKIAISRSLALLPEATHQKQKPGLWNCTTTVYPFGAQPGFREFPALLFSTGSSRLQKKIYKKITPGKAILIELDERHYPGSKKNKLWIWKAYRRETGELIDWGCGARDKATLSKLLERLSSLDAELYCTDNWAPYSEVIDEEKLFQGKSQTFYLEQNNGRQRHWYARFRRKSIVVSKTLEMVDLTMALFAACHVNGCIKNLVSLFN